MSDAKLKAEWLAHAETSAKWYLNNQCTKKEPWGGIDTNANHGRFLYEVYKGTGQKRGSGNWAQALAVLDLLDLARRTGNGRYTKAAIDGAHYLKSLQSLDCRYPECAGGMWEHVPSEEIGMSRDMATGAFGLAGFAWHTGDTDFLSRINVFCDWYMEYGTREDGWPWRYFSYKDKRGYSASVGTSPDEAIAGKGHIDGDWQAGGGLCLYYGGKVTDRQELIDEGFKPMMDMLCDLYDRDASDPNNLDWHGSNSVTLGNDDFALIALIAAFREYQDERYLDRIKERQQVHLGWAAEDGSYPNFGSTFVCGIEHLEYLQLAREAGFDDHTDATETAIEKIAEFGFTLQERANNDPLYYGGLYGQSSFGIERDRIHHRSTGYSINFYLKREAWQDSEQPWPIGFSAFGWSEPSAWLGEV